MSKVTTTLIVCVALVALAGAALAATAGGPRPGSDRVPGASAAGAGRAAGLVVASPPLRGLHPGATKRLSLTIHNRNRFDVRVRSISVRVVARTSKRNCSGRRTNIRVSRSARVALVVRARGSARVVRRIRGRTVPVFAVTMPPTVHNACQGATFTLRYRVGGTRR